MKPRSGSDEVLRCSFCHKSQDAVAKLISSPSDYPRAYICDECVAICRHKGLEAERADLFEYLGNLPEASLDGVFCSQAVSTPRTKRSPTTEPIEPPRNWNSNAQATIGNACSVPESTTIASFSLVAF